ncbi:unnamed protein product [Arabis nemorensis]|uniref:RBR-type E3 ubiquitin transferase n=1 Tax=Arabis nemorensis TaxID=586526 RepID=A0A565CSF7_9BRAS|nr:unnamed protein product [Arabis nemorensis]
MTAKSKESCVICFGDDIDSDLMFLVDECGHRFCFNCVKKHIEVKLIDRMIPNCLVHRCESQLSFDRCGKFLTLKLSSMWKQRIKEDSTPLKERVYCPYQSCSYLMSKTELFSLFRYTHRKSCFKCGGSFCVRCKVPWHSRLSCTDYKKLHSRPQNDNYDVKLKSLAKLKGWRQCGKCQHMIERTSGCKHITCRCGNQFCYKCGAKWRSNSHQCGISDRLQNEVPRPQGRISWFQHVVPLAIDVMFCGLVVVVIMAFGDVELLCKGKSEAAPEPNIERGPSFS